MSKTVCGVRRVRAGAARCHPPRTRRPTPISRKSATDPATEGILRGAHSGARATAEGRRSANAPQRRRSAHAVAAAPRPAPRPSQPARRAASPAASRHQRVQSRDLRGAAGRLRQPVAGSRASTRSPASCRAATSRPAKRGFCLGESELALSANVDDKFVGNLIVSLTPDNTVAVEEAYGVYTAAPERPRAEVRTLLLGLGYLNDQHQHVWDFIDAPLRLPGVSRRPVRRRRPAAEMGRADRPVPRVRRRARQRRRAFPARTRNKNGIGSRRRLRRTPAATSARATAGARACRTCRRARSDRDYAQTDVAGNDAQRRLQRQEPARDRRLRLEVGAERQRAGHQLQAAGRVLLAPRERRSHLRRRRRARPHQHGELQRRGRAAGTSQGVYQFMPLLARRRALRPARSGHVDYGANAALPRRSPTFHPQRVHA